jgi:phosphoglycerol transferase MdoB-like AlkP superfamily enzyme
MISQLIGATMIALIFLGLYTLFVKTLLGLNWKMAISWTIGGLALVALTAFAVFLARGIIK